MVSISQRMRKVQEKLLAIRIGSGAVMLPKNVKRIHLRFAPKMNGGHMGPRKFWRQELVRLKYHNPAVPMTVDHSAPQDEKPLMSIHFAGSTAHQTSSSATSSPAAAEDSTTKGSTPSAADSTERIETINMGMKTNGEIMQELMRITKAYPIEPTAEEKEEMQQLEEYKARSARDSKLSQEVRARQKREKELLEQARGDMAGNAA